MKTFFSNTLQKIFCLFVMILSNITLFAQGVDPFPANPSNSVPIDGGLLALLAAGAALGAKHLLQKNKNDSTN